jgi:diacylglycerol O-acyltransferase
MGDDTEGKEIRAMIPVNLRPMEEAYKLGNQFGLVPLVLPIGITNPIERVYEVRSRMAALKGSTQPLLAFGLLAVAGLLIKPAQDAMLGLFSRKTTAVMTNVPGPREALKFLCGSRVTQCMFWVPQSGTCRPGRVDPELRRRRAVWRHHRHAACAPSRSRSSTPSHPSLPSSPCSR